MANRAIGTDLLPPVNISSGAMVRVIFMSGALGVVVRLAHFTIRALRFIATRQRNGFPLTPAMMARWATMQPGARAESMGARFDPKLFMPQSRSRGRK